MKQGDYGVTCAKFLGSDGSPVGSRWCNQPATKATVQRPYERVSWCNVGHTYCDEHTPANAVDIPLERELAGLL